MPKISQKLEKIRTKIGRDEQFARREQYHGVGYGKGYTGVHDFGWDEAYGLRDELLAVREAYPAVGLSLSLRRL